MGKRKYASLIKEEMARAYEDRGDYKADKTAHNKKRKEQLARMGKPGKELIDELNAIVADHPDLNMIEKVESVGLHFVIGRAGRALCEIAFHTQGITGADVYIQGPYRDMHTVHPKSKDAVAQIIGRVSHNLGIAGVNPSPQ